MIVKWNAQFWVLEGDDGILVGQDERLLRKLRSKTSIFPAIELVRSKLLARPHGMSYEELSTSLTEVPKALLSSTLKNLSALGVIEHVDIVEEIPKIALVCGNDEYKILSSLLESCMTDAPQLSYVDPTSVSDTKTFFPKKEKPGLIVSVSTSKALSGVQFDRVNRVALTEGIPCLYGIYQVHSLQVGPLVVPNQTACMACMRVREDNNYPSFGSSNSLSDRVEEIHEQISGSATQPFLRNILCGYLASEIVQFMDSRQIPTTYKSFISVDLRTLTFERHNLLKVPHCQECGVHTTMPFTRVFA